MGHIDLCIGQRMLLPLRPCDTSIARMRRLVRHRSKHLNVVPRTKSSLDSQYNDQPMTSPQLGGHLVEVGGGIDLCGQRYSIAGDEHSVVHPYPSVTLQQPRDGVALGVVGKSVEFLVYLRHQRGHV